MMMIKFNFNKRKMIKKFKIMIMKKIKILSKKQEEKKKKKKSRMINKISKNKKLYQALNKKQLRMTKKI